MLEARSDGSEIIICTGASEWPPQAGQEVDGYQLMMPKGVERQWHFLLDRSVGRRLTASSTSGAVRHMSFDVFGRGGQVGVKKPAWQRGSFPRSVARNIETHTEYTVVTTRLLENFHTLSQFET